MTAREGVSLRLPVDLKKWIEEQAHREHRSQNAIIVAAVEAARKRAA